ncbi:hypothetical protein GW750_04040 [bacterium]|nr:hypothetical protein [bacterium]
MREEFISNHSFDQEEFDKVSAEALQASDVVFRQPKDESKTEEQIQQEKKESNQKIEEYMKLLGL